MQKWEYDWEWVNDEFHNSTLRRVSGLKTMGQDGWELVAVYDGRAYFKRPIS